MQYFEIFISRVSLRDESWAHFEIFPEKEL